MFIFLRKSHVQYPKTKYKISFKKMLTAVATDLFFIVFDDEKYVDFIFESLFFGVFDLELFKKEIFQFHFPQTFNSKQIT